MRRESVTLNPVKVAHAGHHCVAKAAFADQAAACRAWALRLQNARAEIGRLRDELQAQRAAEAAAPPPSAALQHTRPTYAVDPVGHVPRAAETSAPREIELQAEISYQYVTNTGMLLDVLA